MSNRLDLSVTNESAGKIDPYHTPVSLPIPSSRMNAKGDQNYSLCNVRQDSTYRYIDRSCAIWLYPNLLYLNFIIEAYQSSNKTSIQLYTTLMSFKDLLPSSTQRPPTQEMMVSDLRGLLDVSQSILSRLPRTR